MPEGSKWQYEIKLDGYRALAIRAADRAQLLSRNRNSLRSRFPDVVKAIEELEPGTMLDGEIVALDPKGRPSFNLLQNTKGPVLYYAFDLLAWKGKSLVGLPLNQRRVLLGQALAGQRIRFAYPKH